MAFDPDVGLIQLEKPHENANKMVEIDDFVEELSIETGPLAGFIAFRSALGVHFRKDDRLLCAELGNTKLVCNRTANGAWETFIFISKEQLSEVAAMYQSPESELERFRNRIIDLNAKGEPVKIYCGCGTIIRSGFIHIDIVTMAPLFSLESPEDYYIFPFADLNWNIPDDSVDYIFHEDFIEHIDQLQQIQFLAETLRVLKRGGWHRVNTPNLITTMKRHSDFTLGFSGVYTGEKELWGHVSILTPDYLKEIARMVGYKEVVFTTKDQGVSEYSQPDLRPASDRDIIIGNIYADLLK